MARGIQVLLGSVALLVPLISQSAAISESQQQAGEVVEQTVNEVIAVLRNGDLSDPQRIESIEEIVYGRFDLSSMSRLVLARNWKRFSSEQRDQYVAEFKLYLTNNYGGRLSRYDDFNVEITGMRDEPRGDVTVRTTIVGGEYAGSLLDYRLRRGKDGHWRVIDVVIEGISMVSNFRDQFKEVVSSGGPDLLLQKLREKNAAGMVIDE